MPVPFVWAAALATPFGGVWAVGTGALATGAFFGASHRLASPHDANFKWTFAAFMLGVAAMAALGATLVRISGPLAVVLTFSASIVTGYVGCLFGSLFAWMRRRRMARSRHVPR